MTTDLKYHTGGISEITLFKALFHKEKKQQHRQFCDMFKAIKKKNKMDITELKYTIEIKHCWIQLNRRVKMKEYILIKCRTDKQNYII